MKTPLKTIGAENAQIITRANTGHAVLISTSISPKMKRCNGRTDERTDPLIEVLIST